MKIPTPNQNNKRKNIKILGIIPVIIGAILFFYYSDYQTFLKNQNSESLEKIEFTVQEGENTKSISQNLESEELISNAFYFQLYSKLESLETKYQAGTFYIPKNLTPVQIAETLQQANHQDIWITIPEGLMLTEIAETIDNEFTTVEESKFIKSEFIELTSNADMATNLNIPIPEDKPLEGYLYPDTYRFPEDATASDVITSMLVNLKSKIYEPNLNSIENSEYTFYEILILASILERETQNAQDRNMVADILIRRLESNWALEVDATLLYYFEDWQHEITYQDLEIDNPYNTRKNPGFPPTPISNPGEQTIKAILNPGSNNYWFYLSEENGTIHYAETLEGHNQNIQLYLQ